MQKRSHSSSAVTGQLNAQVVSPGNGGASSAVVYKEPVAKTTVSAEQHLPHAPLTALPLIHSLCTALEAAEIIYCHWKSNAALDRSATGLNDLDLLISRQHSQRFHALVTGLGFKLAVHHGEADLPGVVSYYGFEPTTQQLVHLHAHYQLVLGHDRTKNYRMPIEEAYLATRTQTGIFAVPSVEFEFVIFVLRMMLKFRTWDALLSRQTRLPKAARAEFAYLRERIDWQEVQRLLHTHLPTISAALFTTCTQALQEELSWGQQVRAGWQLTATLATYTRRSASQDLLLKGWRRAENAYYRRIVKQGIKVRLASGGAMIALVGGDGAGKSTAVDNLYRWLSKEFNVQHIHLGKPPRSLGTQLIRASLAMLRLPNKLLPNTKATNARNKAEPTATLPGYLSLVLHLCTAHDRYWSYIRARRQVNNGNIVISDRFPLPQFVRMDGPQIEHLVGAHKNRPLVRMMINIEHSYYQAMALPEMIFILRLHPDFAVERKKEEVEAFVRKRAYEVWEADWQDAKITLIDASKPQEAVLTEIKQLVWTKL